MARSRTKQAKPKNVISRDNASEFLNLAIVWFANAASMLHKNVPVDMLTNGDLKSIYDRLQSLLDDVKKALRIDDVCSWSPIPLTGNDRRDVLNPCYAMERLYEASMGKIDVAPLPPAFSLEFTEYVRTFIPQISSRYLKRQVMGVSSDLLALAIIGAMHTLAYRIKRKEEEEWCYVFIEVYNPQIVDMMKLNGMCRTVVRNVISGGGTIATILVGIAAAIALNLGSSLFDKQLFTKYTSIRIARTGNKTMLKGFDVIDLASLARTVLRLGIASPLYNLVRTYPSEEDVGKMREARHVRNFIETLSRSVLLYESLGNVEELYKVLRTLDPNNVVYRDADAYLSNRGVDWKSITDQLLGIHILS